MVLWTHLGEFLGMKNAIGIVPTAFFMKYISFGVEFQKGQLLMEILVM